MSRTPAEASKRIDRVKPVDLAVGFVGLGSMGAGMVSSLLRKDVRPTVFDADPAAIARAEAAGARPAASLEALAAEAQLVHVAVTDDRAVAEVVGALLEGLSEDAIVLIHSTISPRTCRSLAALALDKQIDVLDAAMTGGTPGAVAGSLTFLVGGRQEAYEASLPILEAMGSHVFYFGESGAGLVAKLVDNVVARLCILGMVEGLALAQAAGLDLALVKEAIRVGSGNLGALDQWRSLSTMAASYPAGAENMAALMYKNGTLGLEAAHELRVALPGAALARERVWDILERALWEDNPPPGEE